MSIIFFYFSNIPLAHIFFFFIRGALFTFILDQIFTSSQERTEILRGRLRFYQKAITKWNQQNKNNTNIRNQAKAKHTFWLTFMRSEKPKKNTSIKWKSTQITKPILSYNVIIKTHHNENILWSQRALKTDCVVFFVYIYLLIWSFVVKTELSTRISHGIHCWLE